MDNNLSSQSPNPSQSPFSGGIIKWVVGIIVIVAVYRFGSLYFYNPAVRNNIGQQIQQGIDSLTNSFNDITTTSPQSSSKSQSPFPTTVEPTAIVDTDLDNATEKVSELTSCMNYADQTIRNTIDYYDRFVDFQNPNKTNFTGLITESSWQTCTGDINEALAISSDTPDLDEAIREFQKQGDATVAAFKEITPYYKQKDFLDDDFALGKAKDAALIAQAIAYVKASDTFRSAVDKQEDLNNTAQMAILAQDPSAQNQMIGLQMFIDAKKVVAVLSEETLNASTLEKSINDLIATQTKFTTVVLADLKSGDSSKYSRWDSVSTSMDDFIASAKNVWRLVRDAKPVPATNEGSVARAVEKFNNVVQNYNTNNRIEMYRL